MNETAILKIRSKNMPSCRKYSRYEQGRSEFYQYENKSKSRSLDNVEREDKEMKKGNSRSRKRMKRLLSKFEYSWLIHRGFSSRRRRKLDLVCRLNQAGRKKRILISSERSWEIRHEETLSSSRTISAFRTTSRTFLPPRTPLVLYASYRLLRDPTEVPIRQFLSFSFLLPFD